MQNHVIMGESGPNTNDAAYRALVSGTN